MLSSYRFQREKEREIHRQRQILRQGQGDRHIERQRGETDRQRSKVNIDGLADRQ